MNTVYSLTVLYLSDFRLEEKKIIIKKKDKEYKNLYQVGLSSDEKYSMSRIINTNSYLLLYYTTTYFNALIYIFIRIRFIFRFYIFFVLFRIFIVKTLNYIFKIEINDVNYTFC